MTNEFKELTSRLAKGLNFEGGTAVLITASADDRKVQLSMKGNATDILTGLCLGIKNLLEELTDGNAQKARDRIKQEIIADEERRFQFQNAVQHDESEAGT